MEIKDCKILCLSATPLLNNPFDFCDVVTTTTHKTLRGPRAAMIFFKKDYEKIINDSVFPGLQGGPHENKIAAIAYQLGEVMSDNFKSYSKQVIENSKVLADEMIKRGYKLVTDGTDNHLILVDLTSFDITGSKIEKMCELADIYINKNTVITDKSPMSPHGIRIGTPAMTTRGFGKKEFIKTAEFLDRCIQLSIAVQKISGKRLVDFIKTINSKEFIDQMSKLKIEVRDLVDNKLMKQDETDNS